ncbi:uncharacterized protein LOC141580908 [Saimiri boliviensis]|uniref:uncharacterized protein LOC141580908 n=1 Tax=Saimiri boliviensis TaxID=27679 RepID=UPI003D7802FC
MARGGLLRRRRRRRGRGARTRRGGARPGSPGGGAWRGRGQFGDGARDSLTQPAAALPRSRALGPAPSEPAPGGGRRSDDSPGGELLAFAEWRARLVTEQSPKKQGASVPARLAADVPRLRWPEPLPGWRALPSRGGLRVATSPEARRPPRRDLPQLLAGGVLPAWPSARQVPPPNAITQGIRFQRMNFWGNKSLQSITEKK